MGTATGLRRKKSKGSVCLIGELPSPIVVEILSRLPIHSLLHCKCVCKAWREIVSDPFFGRTQLARASDSASNSKTRWTSVMAIPYERTHVNLFELQPTRHHYTHRPPLRSTRFKTKLRLPGKRLDCLAVVGCCNGLLCLYERTGRRLYLCNPILGEYLPIQPPQTQPNCKTIESYMMGFSSVTGRYKILRFVDIPSIKIKVQVQVQAFTIGSQSQSQSQSQSHSHSHSHDDAWRNLGYTARPHSFFSLQHWHTGLMPIEAWQTHGSVTLNGALHWITPEFASTFITCFHIHSEQFHPFPHPPQLKCKWYKTMQLKVLQNCLCMVVDEGLKLTIWSMKEYGVAESWTKLCRLDSSFPDSVAPVILRSNFHPFTDWKDGEMLFSATYKSTNRLISFNPIQKQVAIIQIYGMKLGTVIPIDFAPSLLSLKDIAVPDSVKIVGINN